jgi:hypothetical protein
MHYSRDEKLKAVVREIAMRRRAYPKWVNAGKITQYEADYQLALMEAIARDYAAAEAEQK